MILDGQLMFTGGPGGIGAAPTGTTLRIADLVAGTSTSNQIIDLGIGQTNTAGGLPLSTTTPNTQPFRDIGIGDDPAMKILVQPTGVWGTCTSLTVALQGAPDSGTGTPGSFTTYYSSVAATLGQLNAGQRLLDMDMPRPPAGVAEPRFLQLNYTVGGSNFTGTSWLIGTMVLDRMDQVYNATTNSVMGGYPAGITVAN